MEESQGNGRENHPAKRLNFIMSVKKFATLYRKGMAYYKKLWKWERGRQASGYHKMLICGAKWPLVFDMYILKFPKGCKIPKHTDKVKVGRHFRLNFILKQAKKGGVFLCAQPIFESSRIKLFRPDITPHEVTEVKQGNRYLLSVGWIMKDKR